FCGAMRRKTPLRMTGGSRRRRAVWDIHGIVAVTPRRSSIYRILDDLMDAAVRLRGHRRAIGDHPAARGAGQQPLEANRSVAAPDEGLLLQASAARRKLGHPHLRPTVDE